MVNVWQIAAGDATHRCDDLFLDHDVMFMGPGRYGSYEDRRATYDQLVQGGKWKRNKIGQIRRFVEEVHAGDVILLRLGHKVIAIGLAHENGYAWSDAFDDVFGWDLQHTRRVLWRQDLKEHLAREQPKEGFFARQRSSTFTAVNSPEIRERVEPLMPLLSQPQERPLQPLPALPPKLDPSELGRELFARGIPNDAVDKVVAAIERQRRLWRWYDEQKRRTGRPTEHEVVAHMVLPLLLALGWSEQLLAIEWRHIDLAGFSDTPTDETNCVLVCEAKGMGHGLQNVLAQAKRHVDKLGLRDSAKILLTDGARLYLHERADGKWSKDPVGYVNVNAIRTRHLVPPNTNAVATIVALTPAGVVRGLPKGP